MLRTIQSFEVAWVMAGLVAIVIHSLDIVDIRREGRVQKASGENGLLGYIVFTDRGIETFLLVVQGLFLVPGILSLFTVSRELDLQRVVWISFLTIGQYVLGLGLAPFLRYRRREALRRARALVIPRSVNGALLGRIEESLDRAEARDAAVAADLRSSNEAARRVEGSPGEAGDEFARGVEDA